MAAYEDGDFLTSSRQENWQYDPCAHLQCFFGILIVALLKSVRKLQPYIACRLLAKAVQTQYHFEY